MSEYRPETRSENPEYESVVIDGSRLYIQDTEPSDGESGDVWIDTS